MEFQNLSSVLDQRTQPKFPRISFCFLYFREMNLISYFYFIILIPILLIIFLLIFLSICHVLNTLQCDNVPFYQAPSMCTCSVLLSSEGLNNLPTVTSVAGVRSEIRFSDPKTWLSITLYLPHLAYASSLLLVTQGIEVGGRIGSQGAHINLGMHFWPRPIFCRGS